jgi:hypothetical protein
MIGIVGPGLGVFVVDLVASFSESANLHPHLVGNGFRPMPSC